MAALNRRGGAVPANNGAVVAAAHGGDGGAGRGAGVYQGAANNGALEEVKVQEVLEGVEVSFGVAHEQL